MHVAARNVMLKIIRVVRRCVDGQGCAGMPAVETVRSTARSHACSTVGRSRLLVLGSMASTFLRVNSANAHVASHRFKVMDNESYSRDSLAAWACIRLDRLQKGLRFLHLFDANGIQSNGVIFVKITKYLRPE